MLASDPKFSAKIGVSGHGNIAPKQPAAPAKPAPTKPAAVKPATAKTATPAPVTPTPASSSESVKLRAKIHTAIKRSPAPFLSIPRGENFGVSDSPDTPLVTVAIALYNEPKFIADAIESVKRQTFQNFEAIIVDDCSTDNSRAALKKAIGPDARFRVAQHLKNTGVNGARNTAIRLARAPLIAFLDADDFFLPDSLELRLNSFLDNCDDHVAGVFSGIAHAPENVTFNYTPSSRKWSKAAQTFLSAEGDCPFNMHAPLLRTDVLKKMGGFDEGLRDGAEDWDMWQRVMRHGYVFLPVPIVLRSIAPALAAGFGSSLWSTPDWAPISLNGPIRPCQRARSFRALRTFS